MNLFPANPIWEALCTHQSYLNQGNAALKFFPEDICPFVGLCNWDNDDFVVLETQLPANRSFSVLFYSDIHFPASFEVLFTIPLYQMVCTGFQPVENTDNKIIPLTKAHVPQMLMLTEQTRPGPFYQRTIEFGNYFGIFDGTQLVSMAGQRLQTHTHCEVSAICTHPHYTGKGYAAATTQKVCNEILKTGKTPFLHVRQDNTGAIHLYRKLGFEISTAIFFAIFKKRGN